MIVLNFIFAVTGWIWLVVVVVAALVIGARRKSGVPRPHGPASMSRGHQGESPHLQRSPKN